MSFVADTELIAATNTALLQWKQGDVLDLPAIAWLGAPDAPLTEHAASAEKSPHSNLSVLFAEADGLVVVTQTCDLVRDCSSRPHVELARLVRLDEPAAGEARKGSRPRFVPVPALGEDAFADLDVVMTAEKTILTTSTRRQGLASDSDVRRFARGVGRSFSRFAFPDDLSKSLRGLVSRIRDKHDRSSPEGRALAALEEIRVTGSPAWAAPAIDVFLTFAPPSRPDADEVCSQEEWDEIVDSWIRRSDTLGVVRSIDGAMIPLDELTAREYVDSDPLDLDYLSWSLGASSSTS